MAAIFAFALYIFPFSTIAERGVSELNHSLEYFRLDKKNFSDNLERSDGKTDNVIVSEFRPLYLCLQSGNPSLRLFTFDSSVGGAELTVVDYSIFLGRWFESGSNECFQCNNDLEPDQVITRDNEPDFVKSNHC